MIHSTLRLGLIGLFISGAAGLALAQGAPQPTTIASADPVSCGVSTFTERGMMKIEGIFQSATTLTGEYRFVFKSSGNGGSTNIRQGGSFIAEPGTAVPIGRVMVNSGAQIDVTLTVTADGKTYDCSQPVTAKT